MSGKKEIHKYFEIENGKLKVLPMRLKFTELPERLEGTKRPINSNNNKNNNTKPSLFRLTSDIKESPKRTVKRKLDNNVRKELFKLPKRPTFNPRTSSVRKSLKPQKLNPPKIVIGTPLLDAEKAEEILTISKRFEFPKPIQYTPVMKNSPKSTPPSKKKRRTDSNEVFLTMENECNEKDNQGNLSGKSPLSLVCNLLETTKLSTKETDNSNKPILCDYIEKLQRVLEKDQQELEHYQKTHKENLNEINRILNEIQNVNNSNNNNRFSLTENKENLTRKSERLASKQTNLNLKDNTVSPTINVAVNLRKSVLTKNLSNTNSAIESPKFKKAVDMYNSMRYECNVLCTPKLDKKTLNSPKTDNNMNRSLSRRIQQQCLMLQDTPIAKK